MSAVPFGLVKDLALEEILLAEREAEQKSLWRRRRYLESRAQGRLAQESRDRISEMETVLAELLSAASVACP